MSQYHYRYGRHAAGDTGTIYDLVLIDRMQKVQITNITPASYILISYDTILFDNRDHFARRNNLAKSIINPVCRVCHKRCQSLLVSDGSPSTPHWQAIKCFIISRLLDQFPFNLVMLLHYVLQDTR